MPRPPFPKNLREFQRQFATEEACQDYLAASRWPEGFACRRCGESLQEAFNLTPEQAKASEAIADAMGLDKSRIQVIKGGTPSITDPTLATIKQIPLSGNGETVRAKESTVVWDQVKQDLGDERGVAAVEKLYTAHRDLVEKVLIHHRPHAGDHQADPAQWQWRDGAS